MRESGYALFDTAIGRCGIAWGDDGIVALQLPEADDRSVQARLLRRRPQAKWADPPPPIAEAVEGVVAVLGGEAADLSRCELDFQGIPNFHRQVYAVTQTIKPGSTLTYGEIAGRLGAPGAARAVGQALGRNPFAIIVPCHRVVAAGGKAGGFSARGGRDTKLRILDIESGRSPVSPELFGHLPRQGRPTSQSPAQSRCCIEAPGQKAGAPCQHFGGE